MSELEAGQKLLNEYAASLEAEAAARQQVINLLKSLLQQQVHSNSALHALYLKPHLTISFPSGPAYCALTCYNVWNLEAGEQMWGQQSEHNHIDAMVQEVFLSSELWSTT